MTFLCLTILCFWYSYLHSTKILGVLPKARIPDTTFFKIIKLILPLLPTDLVFVHEPDHRTLPHNSRLEGKICQRKQRLMLL